jgi:hypothetical protein
MLKPADGGAGPPVRALEASLKQLLKRVLFPGGERPHKVRFGPAKGLTLLIDPAAKSQRILGLDEAEIARPFARLVAGARAFIDVGASDGYYAVLALKLNPSIQAVSCEPREDMRPRYETNLRLNGLDRGGRSLWVGRPVGAEGARLDDLAGPQGRPLLVKIDVDGAEIDVLRSGPGLFQGPEVSVILETHSAQLENEAIDLLKAHGFDCTIVPNAWWRLFLPERRPLELNRWVVATKGRPGARGR